MELSNLWYAKRNFWWVPVTPSCTFELDNVGFWEDETMINAGVWIVLIDLEDIAFRIAVLNFIFVSAFFWLSFQVPGTNNRPWLELWWRWAFQSCNKLNEKLKKL